MVTLRRASRGSQERSLAGQFLVLQIVVVLAVLAIVGLISLRQSTLTFGENSGARMRAVAESVAERAVVRQQLEAAQTSPAARDDARRVLGPALEQALQQSAADEIEVLLPDGTVLVSSDPRREGRPAVLGDSDALEGRSWTGSVDRTAGEAVAGHAPVLFADNTTDEDLDRLGDLLGVVVVEEYYPTAWERLTGSGVDLSLYLGLGAVLGAVGSFVVSRVVKRRTQGLGAGQIAMLADHREALLHSIREGVVAVGTDGRVTMVNDAAVATLGLVGDPVGRPVGELGLDPRVVDLLSGETEVGEDALAVVGDRVLVVNRREASSRGEGIGTVTTMRDRTELVSLQRQLSSNLSLTDTLRAQTHEFANQLHTISGLVQLGEYDELAVHVGALARRRAELSDFVTARVEDLAVAALIVAKSSTAAERGVRLRLTEDSALPALDPADSADLITVLGNLVDNAVDACAGVPEALVTVSLQAGVVAAHLEVADNGPGVPEELREAVFVRGFSTKPEVVGGRGIGLPLVQLICTRRGGSIEVHQRDGAVFSVRMPLHHDDLGQPDGPGRHDGRTEASRA